MSSINRAFKSKYCTQPYGENDFVVSTKLFVIIASVNQNGCADNFTYFGDTVLIVVTIHVIVVTIEVVSTTILVCRSYNN